MEVVHIVPGIECPESRMFGYPTRMADTWSPRIEEVVEPACSLVPLRLDLRVERDSTEVLGIPPWSRHPLRRIRGHLAPLQLGDSLILDMRGETTGNFSLFMTVTTRILLIKKLLHDHGFDERELIVLVHAKAPGFFKQILDALQIRWLATDAPAYGQIVVQKLTPPELGPFLFLPEVFPEERGGSPERVFINRKASRTLTNEDQVVRFLRDKGYEDCSFEGMSIQEQWAILRRAKEVVAIHGAGITNLLVSQLWRQDGGPKVVEIFPPGYRILLFRYLTAAVRGRWCAVRGQISSAVLRDVDESGKILSHMNDSLLVHLDSLAAALEYLV